jgi:hypothetical protein
MEMYEMAVNCENTEGLEVLDKALENQLDVFPDYVDCFYLRIRDMRCPIWLVTTTTPSVDVTAANELTLRSPTAGFFRF